MYQLYVGKEYDIAIEFLDVAIAKANLIYSLYKDTVLVVDMGTGEVMYERGL